ncbi:hypothetical protein ACFL09_05070 [Planctomycetota bacterium]
MNSDETKGCLLMAALVVAACIALAFGWLYLTTGGQMLRLEWALDAARESGDRQRESRLQDQIDQLKKSIEGQGRDHVYEPEETE